MKKQLTIGFALVCTLFLFTSCQTETPKEKKVWAWVAGSRTMAPEKLERYFRLCDSVGIDAVIMQVHGGKPDIVRDSSDFIDYAAIEMIQTALPYAKKYKVELHAWVWATNRCEKNLRTAHPDWYQVNALGQSCLENNLYGREHYRWLCPTRPESTEYLKERVAELAKIEGLAGVHLDFIRYPDAILPYGLHESRGVVQDKVYPQWDHCYCPACREAFKAASGIDPIELEDPTSNQAWMEYRWRVLAKMASEAAAVIQAHGKVASAAVFASPEESKKLVRQDWAHFEHCDVLFPMIYHKFYNQPDEWIETATREGVEALKAASSPAYLCSGLFVGHMPKDKISELFDYAIKGGTTGICLFSLEGVERNSGYWAALGDAIKAFKNRKI